MCVHRGDRRLDQDATGRRLREPDGGQHRQPLPAAPGEDGGATRREKGAPPAHREAPPRGSRPAPARRRRGRAGTRRAARPGRGASRPRRVAVARLADRARVEEPAAGLQVDLGAARRVAADRPAAVDDRERDVAVADDRDLGAGVGDRVARRFPGEDVLPDRVARAAVVETDALALGARSARPASQSRASAPSTPRVHFAATAASPAKSSRSSVPSTPRSWLPARQTSVRSIAQRQHSFGCGAVADEIAEAPDGVGRLAARSPRPPPRARGG